MLSCDKLCSKGDVRRGKNTVIVSRWANCLTSRGRIRGRLLSCQGRKVMLQGDEDGEIKQAK